MINILKIDWKNKSFITIISGWNKLLLSRYIYSPLKKYLKDTDNDWHIQQQKLLATSMCSQCPFNKDGWCDPETSGLDINGDEVFGCGCKLEAKREEGGEECPRGLWENWKGKEDWNKYIEDINNYYITNKYNFISRYDDYKKAHDRE